MSIFNPNLDKAASDRVVPVNGPFETVIARSKAPQPAHPPRENAGALVNRAQQIASKGGSSQLDKPVSLREALRRQSGVFPRWTIPNR